MLDNRSGVLYASGAIVLALLMRLFPEPCPLQQASSPDASAAVPAFGTATNLNVEDRPGGALLTATSANGRHRLLTNVDIPKSGPYRLSVETRFAGSQHLMIELGGGAGQKYGVAIVDPKDGKVIGTKGAVLHAAAQAVSGRPGWYRWSVDMDYAQGGAAFDFAILTAENIPQFAGTDTCQVVISKPSFTPLPTNAGS